MNPSLQWFGLLQARASGVLRFWLCGSADNFRPFEANQQTADAKQADR